MYSFTYFEIFAVNTGPPLLTFKINFQTGVKRFDKLDKFTRRIDIIIIGDKINM